MPRPTLFTATQAPATLPRKLVATHSWQTAARKVYSGNVDGVLLQTAFSAETLAWLEAVAFRQARRQKRTSLTLRSGPIHSKNPVTAARKATANIMGQLLQGLHPTWRNNPACKRFARELVALAKMYSLHCRPDGALGMFLNILQRPERGWERSVHHFHRDWWMQKYTDLPLVARPTRFVCTLLGDGTELITARNSCRTAVSDLPFKVGKQARFYTARNPQRIYALAPQTALLMPIDNAGPIHRAPLTTRPRIVLKMQNLLA